MQEKRCQLKPHAKNRLSFLFLFVEENERRGVRDAPLPRRGHPHGRRRSMQLLLFGIDLVQCFLKDTKENAPQRVFFILLIPAREGGRGGYFPTQQFSREPVHRWLTQGEQHIFQQHAAGADGREYEEKEHGEQLWCVRLPHGVPPPPQQLHMLSIPLNIQGRGRKALKKVRLLHGASLPPSGSAFRDAPRRPPRRTLSFFTPRRRGSRRRTRKRGRRRRRRRKKKILIEGKTHTSLPSSSSSSAFFFRIVRYHALASYILHFVSYTTPHHPMQEFHW